MNDLKTIESLVLSVNTEMPPEQVLGILDRTQWCMREMRRIHDLAESVVLEWVTANGKLVVNETKYYYAGTEKVTKCRENYLAFTALMDAEGGDMETVCKNYLASGAVKYGAAKAILSPETFDKCFEVVEKDILKTGTPTRKLLLSDANWQKRKHSLREAAPATPTGSNGAAPLTDTEETEGATERPAFEPEVRDAQS